MNRIVLNSNTIEEILSKGRKIENLTFAMQDMLKQSGSLKNEIVSEHNKYIEHILVMNNKLELLEKDIKKIEEKGEKIDELYYIRNEFTRYVSKEEADMITTIIDDIRADQEHFKTLSNQSFIRITKNFNGLLDSKLKNIPNKD